MNHTNPATPPSGPERLFAGSGERERLLGELKGKTDELEESQSRLRLALDAAGMAFWDFDPIHNTTTRSAHHDRLYGYSSPLAVWNFETFLAHVHPEDQDSIADRFARALELDEAWRVECRVVWPDNSIHWIATQGTVFRGEDGTPNRVVGIVSDVTARKRADAERERLLLEARRAREEAEAANRGKTEFLSAMSHELRTPLNAIGGYAELLEMGIHGPITEAQRTALERILNGQQHLLVLINDILSYARLEAGNLDFHPVVVAAREVLLQVEPLVRLQADAKGITLDVTTCNPGLMLLADEERVRQILLNLAGNAVKFTEPGGRVEIRCDANAKWTRFEVRDNGCGIEPEDQDRIFDAFRQVGRRLNEPREGVGLGLAISRDLAGAMGGDLSVHSVVGEGSTFVLRLPRPAAEAPS